MHAWSKLPRCITWMRCWQHLKHTTATTIEPPLSLNSPFPSPRDLPPGTTAELLGLGHLGSEKEAGKLVDYVSKEKALHDIQFRGAISDL
jgi:hypothetical protein